MFWCDRRRFLAALLGVSDSRGVSRAESGRWRARPPLLECGAAGRCLLAPVSGLTSRDGFFCLCGFFADVVFFFSFFIVFFCFVDFFFSFWLWRVGIGWGMLGLDPLRLGSFRSHSRLAVFFFEGEVVSLLRHLYSD